MSENTLHTVQKQVTDLLNKDLRRTPLEIYSIFQIYDIYSDGAFQLIIKGQRVPNDQVIYDFLSNVYSIADLYTRDLSYLEDNLDELQEKQSLASRKAGVNVTKGDLSYWTYGSLSTVKRAYQAYTKATCTIVDILDFGLIPTNYVSSITNQYMYYRQLLYIIMRALAYDGINPITQEELAEKTTIDIDNIKHPERLCRNVDLFFDSLSKIMSVVVPYDSRLIETKRSKRERKAD